MSFNQILFSRRYRFFAFSSLISIIVLSLFLMDKSFYSSAEKEKTNDEPASEGRVITPAGKLVMDATTGQPAVGALTMDFVARPTTRARRAKGVTGNQQRFRRAVRR